MVRKAFKGHRVRGDFGSAGSFEFDNKLWTLFGFLEFASVEVPTVAAGVQKDPAMVGLSCCPSLNCVGHVKDNGRRVGRNLSKRETVFVPRSFKIICRNPIDNGTPGR